MILASKYKKGRMTSYSSHSITDYELFNLFNINNEEFSYKGDGTSYASSNTTLQDIINKNRNHFNSLYVLFMFATMIMYGHHSAHEILTTATNFDFEYNLNDNSEEIINRINKYICDRNPETLVKCNKFIVMNYTDFNNKLNPTSTSISDKYYKEKYLKYKQKYLLLKQQQ